MNLFISPLLDIGWQTCSWVSRLLWQLSDRHFSNTSFCGAVLGSTELLCLLHGRSIQCLIHSDKREHHLIFDRANFVFICASASLLCRFSTVTHLTTSLWMTHRWNHFLFLLTPKAGEVGKYKFIYYQLFIESWSGLNSIKAHTLWQVQICILWTEKDDDKLTEENSE